MTNKAAQSLGKFTLQHRLNISRAKMGSKAWNKGQSIPLEQRFWPKVKKTPTCWIWTGSKNRLGYGDIRIQNTTLRKRYKAHRLSYILNKGEIPGGLFVCHSCDNPSCVNPNHLWLGTMQDNMADMVKKGRQNKGERNGHAKLSNKQAREIRQLYKTGDFTQLQLAKRYGISDGQVCDLVNNKTYKV